MPKYYDDEEYPADDDERQYVKTMTAVALALTEDFSSRCRPSDRGG
jgi:hypothetical protein